MEKTEENIRAAQELLAKAKGDIAEDMKSRGIAAVIWDLSTASMQYIPEIMLRKPEEGKSGEVVRITGIYLYDDTLYLIEEDKAGVSVNEFYDRETEVKPSVVTLSEDVARENLGNPEGKAGYITSGSIEEWLTIANCYFQALIEE